MSVTELKLPIQVPKPVHAQFIARESPKPIPPTSALTLSKARRLLALPSREHLLRQDDFLTECYNADGEALEDEIGVLVAGLLTCTPYLTEASPVG